MLCMKAGRQVGRYVGRRWCWWVVGFRIRVRARDVIIESLSESIVFLLRYSNRKGEKAAVSLSLSSSFFQFPSP